MDAYRNLAYSLIDVAPEPPDSGTHVRVRMAYPDTMPPVPFNATVWPINTMPTALNAEIVRVTGQAGGDLTILRAQEGTQAMVLQVGDQLAATITKKLLDDMRSDSIQPPPSGSGLPNHLASFADTTGKLLKDSGVLVDTGPTGAVRMFLTSPISGPQLYLRDNAAPVDSKVWRIANIGQNFYLQSINDADTAGYAALTYSRQGQLTIDAAPGNTVQLLISGDAAQLTFNDRAGAVDGKRWKFQAAGGTLNLYVLNDPDTAVLATGLSVTRAGDVRAIDGSLVSYGAPQAPYGQLHAENIYSEVRLVSTNQPANGRIFRILNYQSALQFWAASDALTPVGSMILDRSGNLFTGGRVIVGGTAATLPSLRSGEADTLEVVTADNARYGALRVRNILGVSSSNQLADLTCGPTNFTQGVYVSAGAVRVVAGMISTDRGAGNDIQSGWNLFSTAPIYPGRLDTGWTTQTSWYIASHGAYGLYSNYGLYLEAPLWTSNIACRSTSSFGDTLTVQAGGASITGQTVTNGLTVNVNGLGITGGVLDVQSGVIYARQGIRAGLDAPNGTGIEAWYVHSLNHVAADTSISAGTGISAGGNITAGGVFLERGRTAPLGGLQYLDPATLVHGQMVGVAGTFAWSVVGKMMFITFSISGTCVAAGGNAINMSLPMYPAMGSEVPIMMAHAQRYWHCGFCAYTTGQYYMTFYDEGTAVLPDGLMYLYGAVNIPVQ